MKMKRIFPFFITCLFIIGLIVSCIVLAIRNYMLTAKLNKQADVIYDFFEVRDAIISNRHLLDSSAEHSEDNHLMIVFTHVFRGEDIDKTDLILLAISGAIFNILASSIFLESPTPNSSKNFMSSFDT